jgi:hypothetical protein
MIFNHSTDYEENVLFSSQLNCGGMIMPRINATVQVMYDLILLLNLDTGFNSNLTLLMLTKVLRKVTADRTDCYLLMSHELLVTYT